MKLRTLFCRHTFTIKNISTYEITKNKKFSHYQISSLIQCSKCGKIQNMNIQTETSPLNMTDEEMHEMIMLSL